MVSDKLGSSNIDLPELKGPLAEVTNEENKELNKLPMAEIKPEINQPGAIIRYCSELI